MDGQRSVYLLLDLGNEVNLGGMSESSGLLVSSLNGVLRTWRVRCCVVATFVLILTSCGGPGAVRLKTAENSSDPLCTKVSMKWPKTVSNQKARRVTVQSDTVAAWGDPAIIARCGVKSPGPSTLCIDAGGVGWVMTSLSDGKEFVTFGRTPALEVLVPSAYSPEPLVLGAFTSAAQQIPPGVQRCQ